MRDSIEFDSPGPANTYPWLGVGVGRFVGYLNELPDNPRVGCEVGQFYESNSMGSGRKRTTARIPSPAVA